jgi:hypothetical protein
MSQTASTLLLRNLHDVFGEIDPVRRRAAIDEIFHENAVFYEPNSAYRGRDEIGQRSMSTIRMCGCVWSTDGHPSTPRSHQQSSSRRALRREVSCDRDYAATAKHALVHFSINNKHDAHLTISGAAGESHERYEPITQFGRSRHGFRLYHGNHRIDMRRFEPEFLVAVDLPLR